MLLSLRRRRARAGREETTRSGHRPSATITGDLYTPSGKGPYPAVVLLHGCGGVSPNVLAWAQWLQSEGYAALVVDSFQGRGLRNLCADSHPLIPAVRAADVYAAAAKLQAMGVVDGDRIAAMGFSHGGSTVLAAWRTQRKHPDVKLRALIALYPGWQPASTARCGAAPHLAGGKDMMDSRRELTKLRTRRARGGARLTIVVYPTPAIPRLAQSRKLVVVSLQGRQGRPSSTTESSQLRSSREAGPPAQLRLGHDGGEDFRIVWLNGGLSYRGLAHAGIADAR